jgi:hypothetical protein
LGKYPVDKVLILRWAAGGWLPAAGIPQASEVKARRFLMA